MAMNNSLLAFVDNVSKSVSSTIQETLSNPTKKNRRCNVRKFAQNRVKRLDSSKPRTGASTKSKLAQLKQTPSARFPVRTPTDAALFRHSSTWPQLPTVTASTVSNTVPALPVQSVGLPTCNLPTNTTTFSSSEPNLCFPPAQPFQPIDPELDCLLSEFESPTPSVPLSRRGSFESVCDTLLYTPPPSTTLETPYCGEQVYSPYSDCSDELDSAYCSPSESARVSYNCSPTNLSVANSTMSDWTLASSDWLPPVSSTCVQDMCVISSGCGWVSPDPAPLTVPSNVASAPTIYDQGPPMTPTVSQLLEQYNNQY